MIEGVDYSWARPGGARLHAEGKRFAVRYLYPGGKGLGNAEIDDLRAHGIDIAVVYQEGTEEWQGGFAAGVRQARAALTQLARLNLDQGLPIYFTCDSEATGSWNTALVNEFVVGAASVLGKARTGIYGSFAVIESCAEADVCDWFWQTYAWSRRQLSRHANLYQYSNGEWGGAVDFTRALTAEYGQNAADSKASDRPVAETARLLMIL